MRAVFGTFLRNMQHCGGNGPPKGETKFSTAPEEIVDLYFPLLHLFN